MKPAPFEYVRAGSEGEALACLGRYGDEARILAGGQSLIALLSMRLTQPRVLIDNNASDTFTVIEVNGRGRPGFCSRHGDRSDELGLARIGDLR